jgi:phosphomannomutase
MDIIKFGTDGWRGIMAREFTFDNVRRVAQAIADYVKDEAAKNTNKKINPLTQAVYVGYDKRFQSETFAREIAKVLQGNRLNAHLLAESLPTPAISFLTSKANAGLGVMVTASHNPPMYNGIKIKAGGKAVNETVTKAVESFIDKNLPMRNAEFKNFSARDAYLSYLKSKIDPKKIASKLKRPVMVDYLYGAASGLMEELIPEKKLIAIHAKRDPLFGGINPEPIEQNLKELQKQVVEQKAAVGIALDGDADRIGLVDEKGNYYTPCQVFPLLINYLVEHKKLKGKIVQSVSMGYLSARIARALNLGFAELPVGFKHVAEELAQGTAVMGGEESGGYAWKGSLPERDGILTAMLILEMMAVTGKPVSQLWKQVEDKYGKSFFRRIDYKLHKPVADKTVFTTKLVKKLPKKVLGTEIKELIQIDGLKIILQGDHWLLMRPSGTEPLLRVYAESDSPQRTTELLELAKKWTGATLA